MDTGNRDWAIWQILEDQGRSMVWLAREAGISESYVGNVKAGILPASARFRAACAKVLHVRQTILFSVPPTSLDPGKVKVAS